MKKLKLLFIVVFVCISFIGKTQGTPGCYIAADKTVYPDPVDPGLINLVLLALLGGASAYYSTNPQYDACGWTPTVGTACKVCKGTYTNVLGLLTGCSIPLTDGVKGTFTVVNCNLDDYSWTLGAAAGLFGVFVIKRRNKQ